MAGFALSKLRFKGKNLFININQAALMFVAVAVMIPRYLTINFLGITNTYLAHILPVACHARGAVFNQAVYRQVPDSL